MYSSDMKQRIWAAVIVDLHCLILRLLTSLCVDFTGQIISRQWTFKEQRQSDWQQHQGDARETFL